ALRFPMRGHVAVQGAPGSGKTTIALQRIVYMIDQQYDVLGIARQDPFFTEDTSLVITYNDVMVHYIESLLRDLRIAQVPVDYLHRWLDGIISGGNALESVKQDRRRDKPTAMLLKTDPRILAPMQARVRQDFFARLEAQARALRERIGDI